jgi:Coenzyme PQQ synthesis protein D (PqqD)
MSKIETRLHSISATDGTVILDIEHNRLVTLNTTASFIWERLGRGHSIDVVVEELSQATGANPLVVENDVMTFMDQLTKCGMYSK